MDSKCDLQICSEARKSRKENHEKHPRGHGPATKWEIPIHMNLTNENYIILIGAKNFTERYYRDQKGWLKVSARGRKFRMTAEQVLNHLLPAAAGLKPNLTFKVEHSAL
jgi:hypothetical protein